LSPVELTLSTTAEQDLAGAVAHDRADPCGAREAAGGVAGDRPEAEQVAMQIGIERHVVARIRQRLFVAEHVDGGDGCATVVVVLCERVLGQRFERVVATLRRSARRFGAVLRVGTFVELQRLHEHGARLGSEGAADEPGASPRLGEVQVAALAQLGGVVVGELVVGP
jgi:hypothetical protein